MKKLCLSFLFLFLLLAPLAVSGENRENVVLDGNGAEFVFHGYLCPFVLEKCRNVTFRNFSIDWHRTFHSEGEILAVEDDFFDVRFGEEYPYKIENGLLIFTDFPRPKEGDEHAVGTAFHTPGAAILLEGDARFRFEQAGVRDLQIRGNVFDNCNYGVWGWSVIETRPGIAEDRRAESRYNRNVVIEK